MTEENNYLDKYHLINWLKVIDTSLLRLIDSLKIGDDLVVQDEKLVLNFNSKIQNMLMEIIIDTIDSMLYFGKINILIGSCKPSENWRNFIQQVDSSPGSYRFSISDESLYIDEIKLHQFLDNAFTKIRSGKIAKTRKFHVYSNKHLDQQDAFNSVNKICSQFGSVSYDPDSFSFHLILDGNHAYIHSVSLRREIIDEVRRDLIQIC